ncbi:nuclease HARBI [Salix suchowensis]|nr:nuclease HARBI [Salix suchowensis]
MKPIVLHRLCDLLTSRNLLRATQNVSIREQVIVFLQIIGHNQRFRVVSGRYYRSVETIHRYFRIVLKAILKLYKHLIKDPKDTVPAEIMNNTRFYPYFKDCVGAIDGTHVPANVPVEIQGKFRGRKEGTTQNVLAAITFDLKFLYVLAGWEGIEVVLACCILHNHIMGVDPYDFLMEETCPDSEPSRRTMYLSQREEREENMEWMSKREMIASTMWNDYNTQRNL